MSLEIVKEQVEYVERLNPIVQEALIDYTQDGYYPVNNYLRSGVGGDEKILNSVAMIDNAFALAPPVSSTFVVYRGQEGDIFNTKSYTSASLDMDITEDFFSKADRCCLYKITVTPGSKALPLQAISRYKRESEVLLDRNGEFYITQESMEDIQISTRGGKIPMRVISLVYMPPVAQELNNEGDMAVFEEKEAQQEYININTILSNIVSNMIGLIQTDEEITEEKVDTSNRQLLTDYAYQAYEMVRNLLGADKLPAFDGDLANIIIGAYLQGSQ